MNVYFRKEKIIENNTGYDTSNTVEHCLVEWDEDYGECTKGCGGGTQELGYTVTREPKDGIWNGISQDANPCPSTKTRACNEQPCPINCEGEWGDWGACQTDNGTPAKCGGGKRSRIYSITKPARSGYINSSVLKPGNDCKDTDGDTRKDGDIEEEECNVKQCKTDCVGSWGNYGVCDKQTGIQLRTYNITTPALDGYIYNTDQVEEQDTAVQCVAANDEKQYKNCDVDCEYTWGGWSVNKNKGTRTRSPSINVESRNNGTTCPVTETSKANIDCQGKWEDNGQCEDYWKKQKYTITQEKRNAGKSCPHKNGDVKTLRPGIHTCKAVHNKRCNWETVFGCGSYHHWTTYTPNGL